MKEEEEPERTAVGGVPCGLSKASLVIQSAPNATADA